MDAVASMSVQRLGGSLKMGIMFVTLFDMFLDGFKYELRSDFRGLQESAIIFGHLSRFDLFLVYPPGRRP